MENGANLVILKTWHQNPYSDPSKLLDIFVNLFNLINEALYLCR